MIDKLIKNIKTIYNYDDIKLKEIKYGLETLYITIVKLLIIFIISYFIHTLKELCLLFLSYGILRLVGFGLHAKKSIECWILSITIFTLLPCLIKVTNLNNYLLIILLVIMFILICLYAPADTNKRPLINRNKRIIFKTLSIIITTIYISIILLTKNILIKNLLFYSILLEVTLIIPISYKILGLTYNNYKGYKRKEDRNEIIS